MDISALMEPIYVFGGLIFGAFVLTRVLNYRRAVVTTKLKSNGQATPNGSTPNVLNKYSSFHELLLSVEQGLDVQVQEIAARISDKKGDVINDTGYQTILNQYKQAQAWRIRFESPLGQIADGFAYPLARQLGGDLVKKVPSLLRGFG